MRLNTMRRLVLVGFTVILAACGQSLPAEGPRARVTPRATSSNSERPTAHKPEGASRSEAPATPDAGETGPVRVEGTGLALSKGGVRPELCWVVNTSYPPQCSGVPLEGFDLDAVPWMEASDGVRWADLTARGVYRDQVLHVDAWERPQQQPPPPQRSDEELQRIWAVQQHPSVGPASEWARAQPEYAGHWWEQDTTLVVAFIRDLARLEREWRERIEVPTRVVRRRYAYNELDALRHRLGPHERLRGRLNAWNIDIEANGLVLDVVVDDAETRAIVRDLLGPDHPPVKYVPFLRRID